GYGSVSPMQAERPPNRYDAAAAETRIKAAATAAGVPYPFENPEIRIFKKPRRLELWASGKMVKKYRVGLGADPELDKIRQGDHRTPVGEFYVCTRNDRSNYHLFLGVSYPNTEDAERGLRDKLITKSEYSLILSAMKRKERPPWETGLGGMVGIHGYGSASDWTWGCVALENFEIEELFVSCPLKTPIFITTEG
ncbi:MAG: L,D-transpeptidase family protein, partial [Blastocatellia bacterium]|nr:L,D-transpeptidase family protein [Blastocatellia bacterium]